jgi:glutamyl-tRNA(Gln) amidotransferase subunit E
MLKKTVGATDDDTIVLVWGSKQDVAMGASEVITRAKEATIGVPSETRQALRDGTNGFERILPGPNRMYPDTDLPPRRISREHLGNIRRSVPRPYWENELWYKELRIPSDLIGPLSVSPLAGVFEMAVKEWHLPPVLVAVTLIQFPKRISKRLDKRVEFSPTSMREVLIAHRDGDLAKEGILPALASIASGHEFSHESLPLPCSEEDFIQTLRRAKKQIDAVKIRHAEQLQEIMMGLVMGDLRGRIDGTKVSQRIADATGRDDR